ncbi:uncharacterized protein SCHCODRAFT_02712808 [Schizophyllum commune H4-8]|uniref:Uncharacterized protein n=1 Tax=Schizophyllum commune (strain H4-8 / FGSC 9210) TaxID=578458 RepID=D8QDM8_SCHCM|nr:uncharacterized protein SCHCODRAFT_02712808 [Schizophyllum commune H4-8]KAI5888653.1 hypothetical protein SCHCODRAFT_02712808 [Schizophyllum commune H4-8]
MNHDRALERRMVTVEEYLVEQRSTNPSDDHPFVAAKHNTTRRRQHDARPHLSFIRDELEELQGRVQAPSQGGEDVCAICREVKQVRGTMQCVSREVDWLGRTTAELEREVEGVKHKVHNAGGVAGELVVGAKSGVGAGRARVPQVGSRIAVKKEGEDAVLGSFDGLPDPGGDVPMSGLPSPSSAESKASPPLWTAPIDTSTSSAPAQVTSTAASSLALQHHAFADRAFLSHSRSWWTFTADTRTSCTFRYCTGVDEPAHALRGQCVGFWQETWKRNTFTIDYAQDTTSPVGSSQASLSTGFLSPQVTGSLISPLLTSMTSPFDTLAARSRPTSVSGLPSSTYGVNTHNSGNGASAGFGYSTKNTFSYSLTTYGSASSLGSLDLDDNKTKCGKELKTAQTNKSSMTDAKRTTSPTPLSPPRAPFARPSSASPSPPPRKRYTIALGAPITGRKRDNDEDEDKRYAPRSHSPAPRSHSPRSHSPAPERDQHHRLALRARPLDIVLESPPKECPFNVYIASPTGKTMISVLVTAMYLCQTLAV